MTAREEVLARVRPSNAAAGDPAPAPVPRAYARTGTIAPGSTELLELLRDRLVDYKATVLDATADEVPAAIAAALDGRAPVVPDQGRRAITLVPDVHVCVVRVDQVVETVPDLLARLDPTRPTTFISGPSATSDIELQRVEGVHGPRTLIVVLVDG